MFIALFIICLTSFIYFVWRWLTFWSRQGVKGPINLGLQGFQMEHHEFIMQEIKKYGRIYGGHILSTRFLVLNEPELIKEVFVKHFHIFPHHTMFNLGPSPNVNKMLFFMPGDDNWKRIRSIITPAFTSGKLKAMMSHISNISDNFIENLKDVEKKGEDVDIRKLIGAFTMDVISACAYGIKINSVDNPDHPVVLNAKKILSVDATFSMILSIMVPKLSSLLKLEFFDPKGISFFDKLTNQIVAERKQGIKNVVNEKGKKRTDFIQLMLDSEKNNEDFESDSNSDVDSEQNKDRVNNKNMGTLTPEELTAQGILFFLAGYDTTGAALSHVVYYLAKDKECQQRLYEELKDVKEFSYENLSQLKYLNAVIDETLRLAPSLLRIQRQSDQDFELNGIKIPKGTSIEILPSALHRDPEFWPDPLQFKPERFLEPTHHPWAYLPFGGGPRLCIGQRFALYEMRMCAAKLFSNFEFSLTPGTKLEYFKGTILLTPKNIMVNIKSRN